jgi:hypothetical protein
MESEVTPADIIEIRRLLTLKTADMGDKNSTKNIINKYINEGGNWCMTCDAAIRQMFSVLKNWAAQKGIHP